MECFSQSSKHQRGHYSFLRIFLYFFLDFFDFFNFFVHFLPSSQNKFILLLTFQRTNYENSNFSPSPNIFHFQDYGYTRMKAYNHTHLYFEQISVDQEGDIIDRFYVIKEQHGPYEHSNEL